MILLNFAHPLTEGQVRQVQQITEQKIERVIEIICHSNPHYPLAPQVTALADQASLSPTEWQTLDYFERGKLWCKNPLCLPTSLPPRSPAPLLFCPLLLVWPSTG